MKTKNSNVHRQLELNRYESLEVVTMERNLTCEVGASTNYVFGESVRENEGGVLSAALKYADHVEEWPLLAREIFGNLYDAKDIRPLKEDEQSSFGVKAIETLRDQPSFDMLQSASSMHSFIASESTSQLCDLVAASMKLHSSSSSSVETESPQSVERKLKELIGLMEETVGEIDQDLLDELEKRAKIKKYKSEKQRNALMVNMAQQDKTNTIEARMERISEEAEKSAAVVGLLRSFGLGDSTDGSSEGINSDLVNMLKSNKELLSILEACGRLRASSSKKLSEVSITNQCDVVGVVPDDDISRLMSEEFAFLSEPGLEDITLERILESKASCLKLKGQEDKDSGDVILMVDKSGSMHGVSMIMARALAAAIMMNAIKEDRRVVLCLFDSHSEVMKVTKNYGLTDAIRLLGRAPSDGTDTKAALRKVIDFGFPDLREPDVLLITDGYFEVSLIEKEADRYPEDTRFFGLFLGRGLSEEHKEWMTDTWEILPEEKGKEGALVDIVNTVGRR